MANSSNEVKMGVDKNQTSQSLESLIKTIIDAKKVSKDELSAIMERYTQEKEEIKAKFKKDIDGLSKEAGIDMIKKGFSIRTEKDLKLFKDILSRNNIKITFEDKLDEKILKQKGGVVLLYSQEKKMITVYNSGKSGKRIGYINEQGKYDENAPIFWSDNNDNTDDDLGILRDKNEVKQQVEKPAKTTASEQEIENAKYGLDRLDKYTKMEVNEIFVKHGIDGIKKLAGLHGKMESNDLGLGLQEFSNRLDYSHVLVAVKLLTVYGEDRQKIGEYLGGKATTKIEGVATDWLNPDEVSKHTTVYLEVLKKGKDLNKLLIGENRASFDFVMKNIAHKRKDGELTFKDLIVEFKKGIVEHIKLTDKETKIKPEEIKLLSIEGKNEISIIDIKTSKILYTLKINNNKFEVVKLDKVEKVADKPQENGGNEEYKIKKGDTLWKITKGNKELMKKVKELNPEVKDWNKLKIGQAIKMPKSAKTEAVPQTKKNGEVKQDKNTPKAKQKAEKTKTGDSPKGDKQKGETGEKCTKQGNKPEAKKDGGNTQLTTESEQEQGVTGTQEGELSREEAEARARRIRSERYFTEQAKSSGDIYQGELKDGKAQGQGTLYLKNGDKYSGEWQNDIRHGKGIYTWKNGDKYEGEWQNGNIHGKGILTLKNGNKFEGEYKNGIQYNGTMTNSEKKIIGIWSEGKMQDLETGGDEDLVARMSSQAKPEGIKTEGSKPEGDNSGEEGDKLVAAIEGQKQNTGKLKEVFSKLKEKNKITKEDLIELISAFQDEKEFLKDGLDKLLTTYISNVGYGMLDNGITVERGELEKTNIILDFLGIKRINNSLLPSGYNTVVIGYTRNDKKIAVYEKSTGGFRIGYIYLDKEEFKIDGSQFFTNLAHNDDYIKNHKSPSLNNLKIEYKN